MFEYLGFQVEKWQQLEGEFTKYEYTSWLIESVEIGPNSWTVTKTLITWQISLFFFLFNILTVCRKCLMTAGENNQQLAGQKMKKIK